MEPRVKAPQGYPFAAPEQTCPEKIIVAPGRRGAPRQLTAEGAFVRREMAERYPACWWPGGREKFARERAAFLRGCGIEP